MLVPLLVAAHCYMTDPATGACLGLAKHVIVLRDASKDRPEKPVPKAEANVPTSPDCKPPYDRVCP